MPHLRKLKNCVYFDDPAEMEDIIWDAKIAGLEDPTAWVLPEGPRVFDVANKKLNSLRDDKKVKEDMRERH